MAKPSRSTTKCPTCGTTAIHFDPPLTFEVTEQCGAIPPRNMTVASASSIQTCIADPMKGVYSQEVTNLGGVPRCELPAGHEGSHFFLIEGSLTWTNNAEKAAS